MSFDLLEEKGLRTMVDRLRSSEIVTDVEFDRIYPEWAQRVSDVHWTPVEVARRAAELLVLSSGDRVLDVGAGVGKFCLIGALTTGGTFVGIEQRGNLVSIAQTAARNVGTESAQFIHGNMAGLDWSDFEGIYLYNPFFEHISCSLPPIEGEQLLSPLLYQRYLTITYQKLRRTRTGTRVVTYHGYGGAFPPEYRLIQYEPAGTHQLCVWEKGLPDARNE